MNQRIALALPWLIWTRHRCWIVLGAIYFLAIAIASHLMPRQEAFHGAIGLLSAPVPFFFIWLFGEFTFGREIDLARRESGFPDRMFTLPITNRQLVIWPMCMGVLAAGLSFLLFDNLVLRPRGANLPVLWPTFFCSVLLAWMQAIIWTGFRHSWVRVFLAVSLLTCYIAAVTVANEAGASELLISAMLVAQIPLAYVVALRGVRLARSGSTGEAWKLPSLTNLVRHKTPNLANRQQAQFWFERRLNGASLPVMTGLISIAIVLWGWLDAGLGGNAKPIVMFAVIFPMCLSAGPSMARFRSKLEMRPLVAFLATRPISTGELLIAKMKLIAYAIASSMVIGFGSMVLLCLTTDDSQAVTRGWESLVERSSWTLAVVTAVYVAAAIPILTWLLIVSNLWSSLSGRGWVAVAFNCCAVVAICFGTLFGLRAYAEPEMFGKALQSVPTILGVMTTAKMILGVLLIGLVARRKIMPWPVIVGFCVAWLLFVAASIAMVLSIVPEVEMYRQIGVCAVLFSTPLGGVALAPLALEWNRHRA